MKGEEEAVQEQAPPPSPLSEVRMFSRNRVFMEIFSTGFVQVFFVALNTVMLARHIYAGVFIASFLVSLVWGYNVRRVVLGSNADRISYALGAATGATVGLWLAELLLVVI